MTYLQLDDAFVKFANFHVKEQRFKRPSEVFFALEKTNLLLTTGRESHNTLQQENLYWSEREALDCQSGFISEEEAHQKNEEFFVSTRLISVLEEFRQFLLRFSIRLFFPKDGTHQIQSNQIFSTASCFVDVTKNHFESYMGNPLYVEKEVFETSLDLFFKADGSQKEIDVLKKDQNSYCMFKLYGCFKFMEILSAFFEESSYAEDGEVSQFVQKEYKVSPTFANRVVLASLKQLRT